MTDYAVYYMGDYQGMYTAENKELAIEECLIDRFSLKTSKYGFEAIELDDDEDDWSSDYD